MQTHSNPARFPILGCAFLAVLAAMWGGLLRLDWEIPWLQPALALSHGPLMVSGFLGTLICLERSVALGRWWAYGAPFLTAIGTLGLVTGVRSRPSALLILLGSAALVWNFVVIVRRQPALFTATMALGAVAWMTGNILWARGVAIPLMVHWWIGFPVLTIVGERLELSRLAPQTNSSKKLFLVCAGTFLAGLLWTSLKQAVNRPRGLILCGAGLLLLALWLARFDIARYTVRRSGLPRFEALHLLAGYCWLAVGGILLTLTQQFSRDPESKNFHYDAALHSIFLGFVFSMIFAHAPIIFPAVTGRVVGYRKLLYTHGVLLHASVILRVLSDLAGRYVAYRWSGILNGAAILLFLANTAYCIRRGAEKSQAPLESPAFR